MSPIIVMFACVLFMNISWKMATLLVFTLVVGYLVFLICYQESMLYQPCVIPGMQKPSDNPEGYRSPADRGLIYEDVEIKTTDGLRISAWFITVGAESDTSPTLLFCHANAGNVGMRVPNFAMIVEKLKVNILAIDYRGYGSSEGTPSEAGLIEDARSAWRWLRSAADSGRIDGQQVFVFGRSLGGAVGVALIDTLQKEGEEMLPRGFIAENTFTSISALIDSMFPMLAFPAIKERFLRLSWDSLGRMGDVQVPLLFLCGGKDELIPPSHMQALRAKANKSPLVRMAVLPDGTHNDTWEKGGEQYWSDQRSFIDACLAMAGASRADGASEPAKPPQQQMET